MDSVQHNSGHTNANPVGGRRRARTIIGTHASNWRVESAERSRLGYHQLYIGRQHRPSTLFGTVSSH